MKSQGIVMFAHNNETVDYVKQAIFAAVQIKKHLRLPVTLITSNQAHLNNKYKKQSTVFDQVIDISEHQTLQTRDFYNGMEHKIKDVWKNHLRSTAYELTPYDETIVMDTDYIVGNDNLLRCFHSKEDFLIHQKSIYINYFNQPEWKIKYISETGMEMYWATVFYFKKTPRVQQLFALIAHIKNHWDFYRFTWQIHEPNFRNDFAFSMAIHMLNGYCKGAWPQRLPDSLYYITDRDKADNFDQDCWTVSLYNTQGYTKTLAKHINLHVMNKFSLDHIIDEEFSK
jgi:hypothetical protein